MDQVGRELAPPPERGRSRPQQVADIRARWRIPVRLHFGHCCARGGRAPKKDPSSSSFGGGVKMRPSKSAGRCPP
jgi:hypothetical protein